MKSKIINKTKENNLEVLLDTTQAAKHLNIRPQTLNRWRHEGNGPPFVKIGSLVRYRQQDLSIWIGTRVRKNTVQNKV